MSGCDAVGDDGREELNVGAAELKALGLDGGIDRLGQQRPRQAAPLQGAPGRWVGR